MLNLYTHTVAIFPALIAVVFCIMVVGIVFINNTWDTKWHIVGIWSFCQWSSGCYQYQPFKNTAINSTKSYTPFRLLYLLVHSSFTTISSRPMGLYKPNVEENENKRVTRLLHFTGTVFFNRLRIRICSVCTCVLYITLN